MRGKRATTAGLVCAAVALVIVAAAYYSGRRSPTRPPASGTQRTASETNAAPGPTPGKTRADRKTASGKSLAGKTPASKTEATSGKAGGKSDDPFDYGRMPTVKPDANADVKSVVEALRTKTHAERLTPSITAPAFDPEAYKSVRNKYLHTIEPGRVYQSAQPAKGTPRIRPAGPARVAIEQGEKTTLKVIGAPSWPVTFLSFSGGQFPNQLNCITLEANSQGVVATEFLATPGVIEDVHIMASSPMASGQARWVVNVKAPGDGGIGQ